MNIHAIILDGAALEITNWEAFVTEDAEGERTQHLAGALEGYSADELAAHGIHVLEVPEPPEGEVVVSRLVEVQDGVPVLVVQFGPPPAPEPKAEVAMHKIHKAMILTPWGEGSDLLTETFAAIARLPNPQSTLARIEFEKAPNLVREGTTTLGVMALLDPPMSPAQRDELLLFADSLA